MIETNNPEVNVAELMRMLRAEVAMRQSYTLSPSSTSSIPTTMKSALYLGNIEALLNNAEARGSVRTKWPDKLNRFPFNIKIFQKLALKVIEILFRDQHEVNFNLLQALRETLLFNRQLIEQIATLQEQVNATDNHLQAINQRVGATDNHLQAINQRVGATDNHLQAINQRVGATDNHLQAINQRVGATDNHLQAINQRVGAIGTDLKAMDERFSVTDNHLQAVDERVTAIGTDLNAMDERFSVTDNHLQAVDERVTAIGTDLNAMDERFSVTDNHLQAMAERFCLTGNHLNAINERVTGIDAHLQAMAERVTNLDERHIRDDSYLKYDLAQQKRLITLFLEEARQRLPKPFNNNQLQTLVNEEQHLLDAFYVAFEDQFRGNRKDIIDRLKVYLPLIAEAKVGKHNSPILDVGCGRGEWLELLHTNGYTAQGLDINRAMIDQCRSRRLKVIEGDVISYLEFLPDASLGAITGFHIIEHLPFEVLIRLFDETVRVLKSGGLAIFETPNPQNILTSSYDFYHDPTHRKPLPSPMTKFVAESRGFSKVSIMYLNPFSDTLRVNGEGSEIENRFNEYFYGARDYAIVGYKL